MEDVVFIYKKGNSYKVLNLNMATRGGNELKKDGWEHLETLSPSVWLSTYLNVTKEDRFDMLADIMHKD